MPRKTCPRCNGRPNWLVWNALGTTLTSAKKYPEGEPVPCPYCDGTGKFKHYLRNHLKELRVA